MKWFWYAGISAILVYFFTVTLGGILYPGYSHLSQDISQLLSTNSPIRDLMNPLFSLYNLLLMVFGIGLYKLNKHTLSRTASVFVIIIGLLGVILWWFPINTRGTPITFVGTMHIILISIVSLLTVIADFLFWIAYRNSGLKFFAKLSLAAGIAFLITGPIAAFNVTGPYAGLLERITIGFFLFWVLTCSLTLLRMKRVH